MTYTTVTDGVDYPQATHINQFATGLDAIELASWKSHQLFSSVTAAGNVGAGEDDLFSYTLPASTFSADTQTIQANFAGFIIGHASGTRTIKIYFGGTNIFTSGALAETTNCSWTASVLLIRSSSSAVKYRVDFVRRTTTSTMTVSAVTGLTLTNTQIFKVTGESSTAADNDVTFYMGNGIWYPAP
jgi:hypothetical protein